MTSHTDGVNPLRPYYIPPTIGEPSDVAAKPTPRPFASDLPTGKYASKARDILNDIDYKDYISDPSPSVVQSIKDLLDELLWKYTVVLIAQPFGVAKTILQVRAQDDLGSLSTATAETPRRLSQHGESMHDYVDPDSDPEEMSYFTSNLPPSSPIAGRRQRETRRISSPLQSPTAAKDTKATVRQLELQAPDSVRAVISQLWQKEGAWGVWKGSNATFIYTVLQSLLENWSRSCLSAVFNVPDLGVKDDIDRLVDIASPYPWASLCVAAAAAVATGLLLAPLDMVRTRHVLETPWNGRILTKVAQATPYIHVPCAATDTVDPASIAFLPMPSHPAGPDHSPLPRPPASHLVDAARAAVEVLYR